jgi:hypothetical protein
MTFDRDHHDIRGVLTMLALARLMKGRSQAAYYRAAGQHLASLRRRRSQAEWIELIRTYCGLSRRRAYELMAIAAGKSLAELREQGRKRAQKSRKRRVTHKVAERG